CHRNWKSKLDNNFRLFVNTSLVIFAKELIALPNGSNEEKRLFFHRFSESFANHLFMGVKSVIFRFIHGRIECMMREQISKNTMITAIKMGNIDIKGILVETEKSFYRRAASDRSVRNYVSHHIKYFTERRFDKISKAELIEQSNDYGISPEIAGHFVAAYKKHIENRSEEIITHSFEIFTGITHDEMCKKSFLFTSILGKMVFYDKAHEIINIISSTTIMLMRSLKELLSPDQYSAEMIKNFVKAGQPPETFNKFLLYSEELLKQNIGLFLQENEVIMLDGEKIFVCKQDTSKKITDPSVKYLRSKLISYIREQP
ncbi:hypothetical protein, partial [Candidatus Ichthyocystis sparus]|uniref:hypothetical protein n=1 Tax=Candidatus Ichthyocystis sparus TaxID=1561004 RepID=UPI00159EED03